MFSPRQIKSPRQILTPKIGARAVSEDGFNDVELDPHHQDMHMRSTHGDHSLPSAEEVRFGVTSFHKMPKRQALAILAGVLVVLVLVVTIPIGISRRNNDTNTNVHDLEQTSSRFQETITYLLDYVDHGSLAKQGSPQFRAAEWMADDDSRALPLERGGQFLQRYALVVFYYATQGDSTWSHQLKFLTNSHECNWNYDTIDDDGNDVTFGVFCDDNDVVQQLVIDNIGLTGTLPDELAMLNALTRLVLPRNSLYGSLPDTMKQMTTLLDLNIAHNQFAQKVPTWIENLKSLEQLVLSHNSFYGGLPNELEELEELTLLDLEHNAFTGNLQVLGLLQELENVYLQDNQFTGTVDKHWLTTLINVQTIDASNNLLEGGVPEQVLLLPKLQVLDLHDNNLQGSIDSVLHESETLRFLSLFNNRLTGNIPDSLDKFVNLQHFDLSNNKLQGPIPSSLGTLKDLSYLFLSDNAFLDESNFPAWMQSLTSMRELSMRNAGLVGKLPAWFDDLNRLHLLDLSENDLTGTIPSSLGYAFNLRFLLLNRNDLDGTVPQELNQLEDLVLLMLDKNNIHGNADVVCDLDLQVFTTDCNVPEVVCTCCSECCSDDDDTCNADNTLANYEASFESGYDREGYPLNLEAFVPAN